MLHELFIENLAIIEKARIEFRPGLNILTGETGAGKSLLVGALELILGERAKGEWIRAGTEEARVEAIFEPDGLLELDEILKEAGYPAEDGLLIKRTVSRSGKNRIYINDRAATLGFLETLGQRLVDIHGQHEHQSLLHVKNHREILDLFGGLEPLQKQVASEYNSLLNIKQRLSTLEKEHDKMLAEKDLALYQHEELSQAKLCAGEEEELEQERKKTLHVERLREICQEVEQALCSDTNSIVDSLGHLKKRLQEAGQLDPKLSTPAGILETAQHYLEEAAQDVQKYTTSLEGDPERLEHVEERLAALYQLKRKYKCSLQDLMMLQTELAEKIKKFDNFEFDHKALQKENDSQENRILKLASELSLARHQITEEMEAAVTKELRAIGMQQTGFHVNIQSISNETIEKTPEAVYLDGHRVNIYGMDHIEFLIRPNPGQPFKPLHRIASGGELSRIMLALRNVLRRSDKLPTLIFDEVDAGIGGAEAEAVGYRLKVLSRHFQVICITHLPQIAAFGDSHIKVSKQMNKEDTYFKIKSLNEKNREQEIARMLGGSQITEKTLAYAREMLKHTSNPKEPK